MEENNIIGEQPNEIASTTFATASDENDSNCNENGSPIGKFKNANNLLTAYEELEKEFTRKSQKLSELEKSIDSDKVLKETPQYAKEGWRESIKEFLIKTPDAQKYATEISDMLYKDKDLACLPNSLDIAYSKILASKYKSNDELLNNEEFLNENIYNNEKIVGQVIKNYLKNVNSNKVPPVILNSKGTSVGFVAPTQPKSLDEAKIMVEKLFRK